MPQHARQALAQIAPKLVEVTDEVLFADIRERPGLSPRDRSLVTACRPRCTAASNSSTTSSPSTTG